MGIKEEIKQEIMALQSAAFAGNSEADKSRNFALHLKNRGYNAEFLDRAKAIKLGLDIFGWSPEFDDIIIKTDDLTIFIEVKWVRKTYGYYFLHALSQAVIYKHYFLQGPNGKGDVLLCIICNSGKRVLNAEEKTIVKHFSFPEDDILIVNE